MAYKKKSIHVFDDVHLVYKKRATNNGSTIETEVDVVLREDVKEDEK